METFHQISEPNVIHTLRQIKKNSGDMNIEELNFLREQKNCRATKFKNHIFYGNIFLTKFIYLLTKLHNVMMV